VLRVVQEVPRGWLKVQSAAKMAGVALAHTKALIVTGAIPVAIDRTGYMWISADSLRNGLCNAEYIQNQ